MTKKTRYNIKILFAVLEVILIILFVLSFAISIPIFCRSYYYWNIDLLELEFWTDLSKDEIITAYDNIMDYLVFNEPYSTAPLPSSANGMAHFEDVKFWFDINFIILGITPVLILLCYIIRKKYLKINFVKFSPALCSTSIIMALGAIIGIIESFDFEILFNIMHKILFPNKTNITFDEFSDPIIGILPIELWANLFYLIIAIILTLFLIALVAYFVKNKKYAKLPKTLICYQEYTYKKYTKLS